MSPSETEKVEMVFQLTGDDMIGNETMSIAAEACTLGTNASSVNQVHTSTMIAGGVDELV